MKKTNHTYYGPMHDRLVETLDVPFCAKIAREKTTNATKAKWSSGMKKTGTNNGAGNPNSIKIESSTCREITVGVTRFGIGVCGSQGRVHPEIPRGIVTLNSNIAWAERYIYQTWGKDFKLFIQTHCTPNRVMGNPEFRLVVLRANQNLWRNQKLNVDRSQGPDR